MANWASVKLILSPLNEEGNKAIKDLYDKIAYVDTCRDNYQTQIWEVDIEACFGIDIDVYKRGYIYQYEMIDDDLYIYCEDAWDGNLSFWYTLIDHVYGSNARNNIGISYTVEECGNGIFYTNDEEDCGIQGAYLYADGIDANLKLDKLWNFSKEGPFASPKENSGIAVFPSTIAYGNLDSVKYYETINVVYEMSMTYDELDQLNTVMSVDKYLADAEKEIGFPISQTDDSRKLIELSQYLDTNCGIDLQLNNFECDDRKWDDFVDKAAVKKMGETNGN